MRSPIIHLQNQIGGAQFTSAPEKQILCAMQRDTHSITCALVDEPGFRIRVRLTSNDTPEIVLPIAALEYLWAFSHYSWVLIQEYSSAQKQGHLQFDCVGNIRLANSFSLLEWARKNITETGQEKWPLNYPHPRGISDSNNKDEDTANEIFLCSLAWMMHHERGHIVLNHPFVNSVLSQQEERQADKFATDWLLDGLTCDDPNLKKRFLCLSIGILCLQSLEIDSLNCLSSTHPAAYDRIFENTSAYECGTEEIIEATCTIILQFLFQKKDVSVNVDGNSYSDIMGDLLFDIARLD